MSSIDNEVSIHGYNLLWKDRHKHGGGVAIYLASNLPHKSIHFPHPDIESIIVELQIHSQLFTIASFYRPHKRDNATMAKFHSVLSHLRPQNFSNLVICGDFNIDPTDPSDTDNSILLKIQNNSACHRLLQNLPESLQVLLQPLTLFWCQTTILWWPVKCSLLWDHLITTLSWHQLKYSVDQRSVDIGTNLLRDLFGSTNKLTDP